MLLSPLSFFELSLPFPFLLLGTEVSELSQCTHLAPTSIFRASSSSFTSPPYFTHSSFLRPSVSPPPQWLAHRPIACLPGGNRETAPSILVCYSIPVPRSANTRSAAAPPAVAHSHSTRLIGQCVSCACQHHAFIRLRIVDQSFFILVCICEMQFVKLDTCKQHYQASHAIIIVQDRYRVW